MGVSLSFFGPYCDYRLFNTCYFNVNISFHTRLQFCTNSSSPHLKDFPHYLVWFGLVWKTSLFVWFFLTWATSKMQPRPRFCRSSPPRDSQMCILTLSGEASEANLNIIIIVVVILGVFNNNEITKSQYCLPKALLLLLLAAGSFFTSVLNRVGMYKNCH